MFYVSVRVGFGRNYHFTHTLFTSEKDRVFYRPIPFYCVIFSKCTLFSLQRQRCTYTDIYRVKNLSVSISQYVLVYTYQCSSTVYIYIYIGILGCFESLFYWLDLLSSFDHSSLSFSPPFLNDSHSMIHHI